MHIRTNISGDIEGHVDSVDLNIIHVILYSMIDDKKYIEFVESNPYITRCHKKLLTQLKKKINTIYVPQGSDKQIIVFLKNALENYTELGQLNQLFNTFLDVKTTNYLIKKIIKSSNPTDRRILKRVGRLRARITNQTTPPDPCLCDKWEYFLDNLSLKYMDLLKKDTRTITPNQIKYLDYGCGGGKKTIRMADKLGLPHDNVFGTDIPDWGPYSQTQKRHPFVFKIVENNIIPYPDDMFDLITCSFVLHHIEDLATAMSEIKRVIKPNGYLLLIEHDAHNDMDHLLLDIQHMMMATVYDKNDQYIDSPIYAKYYNHMEWDYIMAMYGLAYIAGNYAFIGGYHHVQYDASFYGFYRAGSKK